MKEYAALMVGPIRIDEGMRADQSCVITSIAPKRIGKLKETF